MEEKEPPAGGARGARVHLPGAAGRGSKEVNVRSNGEAVELRIGAAVNGNDLSVGSGSAKTGTTMESRGVIIKWAVGSGQ